MSRLTLVRHGRPVIEPDRPASSWELAADAVAEVQVLAEPSGTWFSSPEPKAVATARALTAAPVTLVSGLREAERTAAWFAGAEAFRDVVREAFACPDRAPVPGWEPLASARRRVVACARDLLAGASGDTVLVGHGTAWTLLVAELTEAEPDLEAWTRMRMPDVAVLDALADGSASVVTGWGA